MAILKHIKSRNSDYSKAYEYLLFQHNEETNKPILDEQGRMILREEYYIDGLNCDPDSFDKECQQLNAAYRKNQRWSEIKSHHYVISFDPQDHEDGILTGEQAQAYCLEFARKHFPGHQALIVTHTDGHNGSGNIHTHIVINSLRKEDVPRTDYMDQANDHRAGYKHRSTTAFLKYLQKELMTMCEEKCLHQVDLLSPAPVKITNEEYWAKRKGQKKLDETNSRIEAAGLKPTRTTFQTQKQFLRDAIEDAASKATSFEEFQNLLLEKYKISVTNKRGRYSYLHPDRTKPITERALGTRYGREELSLIFETHLREKTDISAPIVPNPGMSEHPNSYTESVSNRPYDPSYDYHADPIAILYIRSNLRLVVDLQTNIKAMQNRAYARKVEISNLKQMASTVVYIQEHGYDTREDLSQKVSMVDEKLTHYKNELTSVNAELRKVKEQIRYTGQYLSNKRIYDQMTKARNKKKFRMEHSDEIAAYEEARSFLKAENPDGKSPSLSALKKKREQLLQKQAACKQQLQYYKDYHSELSIVTSNVSAILDEPVERKHMKVKDMELS